MADPISQFRSALVVRGIIPPVDLITDGTIHRCDAEGKGGKGDASYLLHLDGIPAGGFQNWRDGLSWENFRADISRTLTSTEEYAHRVKMATIRKERETEKIRRETEAREKAKKIWSASSLGQHPYLALKGISSHGSLVYKESLVIPLMDNTGTIHSLQFISQDGKEKKFLSGSRTHGCYFLIGEPEEMLCFAEGFATAASIHDATGYAVAVTFNAGNLLEAARELRRKYVTQRLLFCADDDYLGKNNPGITKATEASREVGGIVIKPDFGRDRPKGMTDFNDLSAYLGDNIVRNQIVTTANQEAVKLLATVSLADLTTAILPPTRFVIEPLLPRGHITLLGAHGGAGKSVLALIMAAHVTCGQKLADLSITCGRALYISLEDNADLIRWRLRKIVETYELPIESVIHNLTVCDGTGGDGALAIEQNTFGTTRLVPTVLMEEIRITAAGYDLIIVDNASDAFQGNESDRKQVRMFVRLMLGKIAQDNDAAVLLLAHIDKAAARYGAAGNSYLGSVAWHNSTRSRLALLERNGIIELSQEKLNLGKKSAPIEFSWNEVGILIPAINMTSTANTQTTDALLMQEDDAIVLAAISNALKVGIDVSTSRSGAVTTYTILEQDLSVRFRTKVGKDRFWLAINRLERVGIIHREAYRTPSRHQRERWSCTSLA